MRRSRPAPQEVALRQRHPLGTGLFTEAINAAKVAESKAEKALLLWGDLPAWRRDNAFIHSGYCQIRPSYLHSLRSLFNLHNESVNVWSHLLGAIAAVASSFYLYYVIRPRYDFTTPSDVLVFAFFIGGAVLCLGMSATFHAVLNHSQQVARWGNKLDYTGIVVLIVGSFVPALYYGFFCMPMLLAAYLCLVSLALRGRDITVTAADKDPDMSAWHRMRYCLVGRAVPHPKMAAIPSHDVYRPRLIRLHPCYSRRHHLWLQGVRRQNQRYVDHRSRCHVYLRRSSLRGRPFHLSPTAVVDN